LGLQLSLVDISVLDMNPVAIGENPAQLIGQSDRAMLAPGTTDRDHQLDLSFADVVRY